MRSGGNPRRSWSAGGITHVPLVRTVTGLSSLPRDGRGRERVGAPGGGSAVRRRRWGPAARVVLPGGGRFPESRLGVDSLPRERGEHQSPAPARRAASAHRCQCAAFRLPGLRSQPGAALRGRDLPRRAGSLGLAGAKGNSGVADPRHRRVARRRCGLRVGVAESNGRVGPPVHVHQCARPGGRVVSLAARAQVRANPLRHPEQARARPGAGAGGAQSGRHPDRVSPCEGEPGGGERTEVAVRDRGGSQRLPRSERGSVSGRAGTSVRHGAEGCVGAPLREPRISACRPLPRAGCPLSAFPASEGGASMRADSCHIEPCRNWGGARPSPRSVG